jgi:hypothetical protein
MVAHQSLIGLGLANKQINPLCYKKSPCFCNRNKGFGFEYNNLSKALALVISRATDGVFCHRLKDYTEINGSIYVLCFTYCNN